MTTVVSTSIEQCRFCRGTGYREEHILSRFAGTDYHAHPVTVRCWACNGEGVVTASEEGT